MKITIFGLTITSSWGNGHATPYRALVRALYNLGHQITFFEKDVPYYAHHRDFVTAEYCEVVLYADWQEARARALTCARESELILCASYCPEGALIIDEILALAAPLKAFYDLDTPITLKRLAEGGELEYLRRDQIAAFDLVLSFTGGKILDELKNTYAAKLAKPLYGCVDPDVHRHVDVPEPYRCFFSYMGTFAADRQRKVDHLFLEPARQMPGRQFVLAGSLYPWDYQWPNNVRRFEHVSPPDHPALYSSSRLTLNLTREEMALSGYCPSGRFFEAAACGTPIVSDWFEGLESFFVPGEEILVVNSTDDVIHALNSSDQRLSQIAGLARQRTLDEHTGERRASELLGYCEEARHLVSAPFPPEKSFMQEAS